ncbi:hypothetical protein SCLCIDRAFT_118156, partial [Scleroderma citrinum Foug A]
WSIHTIDEVWKEILWAYSCLINKHGFSDAIFPPISGTYTRRQRILPPLPLLPKHGYTMPLQLVVPGMKSRPFSPSCFDARTAILQADEALTGDASVAGRMPWGRM